MPTDNLSSSLPIYKCRAFSSLTFFKCKWLISINCCSHRNNLGNFHYLCMAVMIPRNMLEKDKGEDLKFGTNPRNSVRKCGVGFPTLITLLVFLLWFMEPCTRVNNFAVFQQSETCMLKPLQISECLQFLPPQASLSFCVISMLESLMLTLSWKGLPAFLWFVLSVLSVLHRFGWYILSKSSF